MTPEDEGSSAVSESGGDPLVDNGLGSPLCREGAGAELSSTGARACRISHFDAAQAPTGNYGFDVHINRGVTDVANDVDAEVLNGVQWSWTLLVAVVHGVIVMLEWCYSLDLLNSSKINGITQRLRETQATFTRPWLELALAVRVGARAVPRDRAPAGLADARRDGADGGDDAGRPVGDRQPAGHDRRAGRMGQRGEPRHARRRHLGHAGTFRSHARGKHAQHLQRRDRRAVVLHGVRQRALVRVRAHGHAIGGGGSSNRDQRTGQGRQPERGTAERRAYKRRTVPRVARQRGTAQLDQRFRLAVQRAVRRLAKNHAMDRRPARRSSAPEAGRCGGSPACSCSGSACWGWC